MSKILNGTSNNATFVIWYDRTATQNLGKKKILWNPASKLKGLILNTGIKYSCQGSLQPFSLNHRALWLFIYVTVMSLKKTGLLGESPIRNLKCQQLNKHTNKSHSTELLWYKQYIFTLVQVVTENPWQDVKSENSNDGWHEWISKQHKDSASTRVTHLFRLAVTALLISNSLYWIKTLMMINCSGRQQVTERVADMGCKRGRHI